jgi:hypothetical protein
VAAYDSQGYLATGGFDIEYPYQPSPLYSASTASDLTLVGTPQYSPPILHVGDISPRPTKRQRTTAPTKSTRGEVKTTKQMPATEAASVDAAESTASAANKPKRVRTGCLTCRERHLKCDEGLPNCQNCRKSSRVCKRGVRLNFIDTQVKSPPMIQPTADWKGMLMIKWQLIFCYILTNRSPFSRRIARDRLRI